MVLYFKQPKAWPKKWGASKKLKKYKKYITITVWCKQYIESPERAASIYTNYKYNSVYFVSIQMKWNIP